MITINFYKDGAYIKGHDKREICNVVSYAMWCCIEDCLNINDDIYSYESCYDKDWVTLGFTYIKINTNVKEHNIIYNQFKNNISKFLNGQYPNRVKINYYLETKIDWDIALNDAKSEIR